MTCKRIALSLVLVPLTAACATADGSYPSLAIRDAERISGSAQPAPPSDPVAAGVPSGTDSGSADALGRAVAHAKAAHDRFESAARANRGAIARGWRAEEGSDSWAAALAGMAQLTTIRSGLLVTLADLDRLYVDAGSQAQDLSAIGAAQAEVAALAAQEDATLSDITAPR